MNIKQYVLSVGYNKNSKIPTLSLNSQNNKYCCSRCGVGGYSVGLYAKIKGMDNKKAYKESHPEFEMRNKPASIKKVEERPPADHDELLTNEQTLTS